MPLRAHLGNARIVGREQPVVAAVDRFVKRDGSSSATPAAPAAASRRWSSRRTARGYGRVKRLRIALRHRQIRFDDRRQANRQLFPRRAAVGRFKDAAVRAAECAVLEKPLLLMPQRGVNRVRIFRIDADVVTAGVFVLIKNLLERCAAVDGAENSALGIGTVRMSQGRDKKPVRIPRIDFNIGNHLRIAQPKVRPGFARVGRFVHPVAGGQIGPYDSRAAADVNNVGIGRSHRDCANGAGGLTVEQRHPGRAIVGRAPHAAIVEADIENVRLARHSSKRPSASGARRSNRAPMHLGISRLRERKRSKREGKKCETGNRQGCNSPESIECIRFRGNRWRGRVSSSAPADSSQASPQHRPWRGVQFRSSWSST